MTIDLFAVPDGAHGALPSMVQVRRSDPVYMAHAYLTKVPVTAIAPFIEAFTEPGDVVLDPFAGSGMTGVAALVTGRRAVLYDVSVLGRHIGSNYVNLVDAKMLGERGEGVVRRALERIGKECVRSRRPGPGRPHRPLRPARRPGGLPRLRAAEPRLLLLLADANPAAPRPRPRSRRGFT